MRLDDPNINYLIISASTDATKDVNDAQSSRLEDMLYNKDYSVVRIGGFYNGVSEQSFLAYKNIDNDSLRFDLIDLIGRFSQKSAIIKYQGENNPKKMFEDGSEKPLGIATYNNDMGSGNKSYFAGGMSFSFVEQKRYYKPTKKEDFRTGMVVEILNNKDVWVQKLIENPDTEWDKLYKLLVKYDKVRYSID